MSDADDDSDGGGGNEDEGDVEETAAGTANRPSTRSRNWKKQRGNGPYEQGKTSNLISLKGGVLFICSETIFCCFRFGYYAFAAHLLCPFYQISTYPVAMIEK